MGDWFWSLSVVLGLRDTMRWCWLMIMVVKFTYKVSINLFFSLITSNRLKTPDPFAYSSNARWQCYAFPWLKMAAPAIMIADESYHAAHGFHKVYHISINHSALPHALTSMHMCTLWGIKQWAHALWWVISFVALPVFFVYLNLVSDRLEMQRRNKKQRANRKRVDKHKHK